MLSSIPPNVDLAGCQWFVQMKFLACMPKHIHSLLLSTDFSTAEAMATFADNIVSATSPSPASHLEAVYEETCPQESVQATSQQKNPPLGPLLLPPQVRPPGREMQWAGVQNV